VDCLIPSAESRLPLAVVDDAGVLLGVIPRVTLLNALGGYDANGETGEPAVEPATAEVVSDGKVVS
jgi:glycine betaine/proline transport system ATP-binding protein